MMEKKYISFDVETSGKTPGKYSMLSLGACVVGEREKTFYREFKPISKEFIVEALRVASVGLQCLDDFKQRDEYNPHHQHFNPARVLELLNEKGDSPQQVMKKYAEWVLINTSGFKPVEAAAPIKFDGRFTAYYFDNFYDGDNPFGHSGEDMNSVYRGLVGRVDASMKELGLRTEGLIHNALEDALQQAQEFEEVLSRLKTK